MYAKSAEPPSVVSNVAWMQMYANPPNVPALSVMFDWTEEPPSAYVESEQRPSTVGAEPRGGASRSWTPAGFPRRPRVTSSRVIRGVGGPGGDAPPTPLETVRGILCGAKDPS